MNEKKENKKISVDMTDIMDRETWIKLSYIAKKEGKEVDDLIEEILQNALNNPDFLKQMEKQTKKKQEGKNGSKNSKSNKQ